MSERVLRTVTRTQGNNAAIKSGTIRPGGFSFEFEEVPVLPQAFRRMVRNLEFDVCEMALTTYLCAREHGVRFTALPIFLVRAFHHGAILGANAHMPAMPGSLEGKCVGVNRGYTVTTGVWARSILQDEYGVDLKRVTWVLSGDEHVEAYVPPANVKPVPEGRNIEDMLLAGELAAAVGLPGTHPDLSPLIPDAAAAGLAAYHDRGHYPINHLVVVRDDVLERWPDVALSVYRAFVESRDRYLEALRAGKVADMSALDKLYAQLQSEGRDPLPYGIGPNKAILEELVEHAMRQEILKKPVRLEEVFAASVLDQSD